MNDLPFVKRGQPITATPWNQLCAAIRACRLIAGNGVRLREMPDGTIITFDGDGADFADPFQVSLVGTEAATIRPGRGTTAQRALPAQAAGVRSVLFSLERETLPPEKDLER